MDEENKKVLKQIRSVVKSKSNFYYKISYESGEAARLYILNDHVFRYHMSPTGDFPEYPDANNVQDKAHITVKSIEDYDKNIFEESELIITPTAFQIMAGNLFIVLNQIEPTILVLDKRRHKHLVLQEHEPISYSDNEQTQTLTQFEDEFFYGGGMQNGRFSHKGETINIVNSHNWNDGGVSSPCPFYWSTRGYGVLRNTWKKGIYDFGATKTDVVKATHEGKDFDAFYFINAEAKDILRDYYELTGQPIFMPEYAFYEAHLNAFNIKVWVKVASDEPEAILFEDGEYYKSYSPDKGKDGIKESLNGEKNNYQFSARAMIDRYKKHDMPLGWFIPNDGYGCGYGQTDTFEGDLENLQQFHDYAKSNNVELALWTESQLEPSNPNKPKKGERDLAKEAEIAGVVALKCDVAWIGEGYSFGLNAIENAAHIFKKHAKQNQRKLIITVNGWAGTQRHAGVWTGDQTGGEWEYIRFHIPTYIGTGLSGQPVVGSDMDGIYAGGNKFVNIRDFQWKTFTPLQLNMDGWGRVQKTPFSFDEESVRIKRAYLKLKSILMPYNYTIGHESISGLPMIRGMFLEFPKDDYAHTVNTQYQFMWGPSILVAPVYSDDAVRDEIYLPDRKQTWIDLFTGEKYRGGKVLNNFSVPLWKIPIFIRNGAIIPIVNPNNNPHEIDRTNRMFLIYPHRESKFRVYEDDGFSTHYLNNQFATTDIVVHDHTEVLFIDVNKTHGDYDGMVKNRSTLFYIMGVADAVSKMKAAVNNEPLSIVKAATRDEFINNNNVYYYAEDFKLNPYLKEESAKRCLLIKLQKYDVTNCDIKIKISLDVSDDYEISNKLKAPEDLKSLDTNSSTSITMQWKSTSADYYEIEANGVIQTNIIQEQKVFKNLNRNSKYSFKIRSVKNNEASKWSEIVNAKTSEDNDIKVKSVTCSVLDEPDMEISNVLKKNNSMWHTRWHLPDLASISKHTTITLIFDFGQVHKVDKMEYLPRADAGNGTIIKLRYQYSVTEGDWSDPSEVIDFDYNNQPKAIKLNGKEMRYFKLIILDAVGGFGSGRQIYFTEMK